jgi:hypothetical protein
MEQRGVTERCVRVRSVRPARLISARRAVSLFLMALFFRVVYKYVFGWFGEGALGHLDSLTSS